MILPNTVEPELHLKTIEESIVSYELTYNLDMAWNKQIEELVDAGIPFRLHIMLEPNKDNKQSFFRTLNFNILNYTYSYTDSINGKIQKSAKRYNLINLALLDFSEFKFHINKAATSSSISIELMPGWVSHLNRSVDMSEIWGKKNLYLFTDFKEALKK